jgi:hypothetical protein
MAPAQALTACLAPGRYAMQDWFVRKFKRLESRIPYSRAVEWKAATNHFP